jgi:O-antigen ligase
MPFHFKALILVMAVTLVMFVLAKPLFVNFMAPEDFARRRNVFLAVTLAAFLIPDFWVFMIVAAVIIGVAGAREPNPAALYAVLLLVIPPIKEQIPSLGLVKEVFALDHLRLMSLVLLLPTALRLLGSHDHIGAGAWPDGTRSRGLQVTDGFVLLYFVIQVLLMLPYESVTASVRRMVLMSMDMLLPYFVLSRSVRSREMVVEVMASFALGLMVLAPLAVVEFAGGWILYAGLQERWGAAHMIGYVTRGEQLRAQVTGGHAIVFGYAMAVAFGCWLYLQSRLTSTAWRTLGFLTLGAGLIATLARGPWVGAAALLLVFLALGPNAAARSMKAIAVIAVIGGIALASPYGGRIIDHLPFIGTVSDETVTYRQRLAQLSWMLIQQNPVFGNPYFMTYMEELRQGEGIIDIVNAYAGIALSYGLVGLSAFGGIFVSSLWRCRAAVREYAAHDADFSLLGATLVAIVSGVLVTIGTTSNYLSIPYIYWSMIGLSFAYVQLSRMEQSDWSDAEPQVADEAQALPYPGWGRRPGLESRRWAATQSEPRSS